MPRYIYTRKGFSFCRATFSVDTVLLDRFDSHVEQGQRSAVLADLMKEYCEKKEAERRKKEADAEHYRKEREKTLAFLN